MLASIAAIACSGGSDGPTSEIAGAWCRATYTERTDVEIDNDPADWESRLHLVTPSHDIRIVHDCPEGCVSCNRIRGRFVSRKTGDTVVLIGSTDHSKGADGVTPSRFRGWRFMNGDTSYGISADGILTVAMDGTAELREQGAWQDDQAGQDARRIGLVDARVRRR
jgi:hypothetical protein